jgi:hypothetical protein
MVLTACDEAELPSDGRAFLSRKQRLRGGWNLRKAKESEVDGGRNNGYDVFLG